MVGPKKNKQVSSDKFSRIEKVGKVGGERVGKVGGEKGGQNWLRKGGQSWRRKGGQRSRGKLESGISRCLL